jgi:uncharacterized membrane protein YpjA
MEQNGQAIMLAMIYMGVIFGYFYYQHAKSKAEIKRISELPHEKKVLEIQKLSIKLNRYKTSHLLHFFITVVSFGGWIIVWILISMSNAGSRARIEKLINNI